MDEQVLAAMARWPDVPAVFGWLRLGRRGQWFLVDRNRPGFDERLHGQGSPITNPQIVAFIERNYAADAQGRWFWQNGPQRVYVDLEAAPRVVRVHGDGGAPRFVDTAGEPFGPVRSAGMGPDGSLLLEGDDGAAVVHDIDLGALRLDEDPDDASPGILWLGARRLRLRRFADPGRELGFVARPRP